MELRTIGSTDIQITPIAMGCWPITGITSINVNEADSLATLSAALDSGINFYDTAYCYGFEGESERMVARALGPQRDQIVIATKGGIHWNADRKQVVDGHPDTLRRQCEESLRRLNTDRVELYYLHAPDPKTQVQESAVALRELLDEGKILSVGVSNFSRQQLEEFATVCPINAYQPHFNMLQREIEGEQPSTDSNPTTTEEQSIQHTNQASRAQLPWCVENNVSVMVYWPLMKGLLAGKLDRNHEFDANDGRRKYPMFHGDEWEKNQDFMDELRTIADDIQKPIAQVVINWTIQRSGITAALCGAKRPEQIRENAAALQWRLTDDEIDRINAAIKRRGPIVSRAAV